MADDCVPLMARGECPPVLLDAPTIIGNCGHRWLGTCRRGVLRTLDCWSRGILSDGLEHLSRADMGRYRCRQRTSLGCGGRCQRRDTVLEEGDQRRGSDHRAHRHGPAAGRRGAVGGGHLRAGFRLAAGTVDRPQPASGLRTRPDGQPNVRRLPGRGQNRCEGRPCHRRPGPYAPGFRPAGYACGTGHHASDPDEVSLRPRRGPGPPDQQDAGPAGRHLPRPGAGPRPLRRQGAPSSC